MDLEKLNRYMTLLLERNEHLNLTGAKTREELSRRHVDDSLNLLSLPEVQAARTLLDVGTGGGLPGLPVAIARPDLKVTLLDATRKKMTALEEFIKVLELQNARVEVGRAEELGQKEAFRQRFDVVVARAVARLPLLLEYTVPFARVGGTVIAFRGPEGERELNEARLALQALSARADRCIPYLLGDQTFTLVVVRVPRRVPSQYPRPQARIVKHPLEGKAVVKGVEGLVNGGEAETGESPQSSPNGAGSTSN